MKKYYANFNANNGTSWIIPLHSNNKKSLLKDVRETAKSERFCDNEASFYVEDEDEKIVYDGRVDKNGRVWYMINNYKEVY